MIYAEILLQKHINSNAYILTHYENRILKTAKMLNFSVQYIRLVIAGSVKFYSLQFEQYCRIHKYYISCLICETELQIFHCNHCREYPQSYSDILKAQESVLPHHLAVSSTQTCLKQNAYIMGICSLLSTFLHNMFYVKDVHMVRHEQQHGMYECPPNILDNSDERHFQYTCVSLEDLQQGISYISNNGKILPLDQS